MMRETFLFKNLWDLPIANIFPLAVDHFWIVWQRFHVSAYCWDSLHFLAKSMCSSSLYMSASSRVDVAVNGDGDLSENP